MKGVRNYSSPKHSLLQALGTLQEMKNSVVLSRVLGYRCLSRISENSQAGKQMLICVRSILYLLLLESLI